MEMEMEMGVGVGVEGEVQTTNNFETAIIFSKSKSPHSRKHQYSSSTYSAREDPNDNLTHLPLQLMIDKSHSTLKRTN